MNGKISHSEFELSSQILFFVLTNCFLPNLFFRFFSHHNHFCIYFHCKLILAFHVGFKLDLIEKVRYFGNWSVFVDDWLPFCIVSLGPRMWPVRVP